MVGARTPVRTARMSRAVHRRPRGSTTRAALVGGALFTVLITGCGSPGDDADSADTATAEPAGAESDAFPVTVETTYGDVTVPEEPQRVVALTAQAAGDLVALDVTPMKVQSDTPDFYEWHPWLDGVLDENVLQTDLYTADGGANAEAIAALEPDLIVVGNYQVPDKSDFDRLNQIAPTVGSVGDALNPDWDEVLVSIGESVGKKAEAEQLVAEVTSEYQAVGDEVPGVSSMTYQWVRVDEGAFGFGNGAVLELFGLQPADNQDNTQNGPPLAAENTDQLDADLLMVWAPSPELRADIDESSLFQNLPSVQAGTVVYADIAFAIALNSADPLSLRWLKDKVAPSVEALATAG